MLCSTSSVFTFLKSRNQLTHFQLRLHLRELSEKYKVFQGTSSKSCCWWRKFVPRLIEYFFTSPTPKSWGLLCGKVDGMHNYILILSRLFNILAIFIHWIKIKKNRSFLAHISSSHYVISVRIFLPWDPHISDNLCQNLSVMRSKKSTGTEHWVKYLCKKSFLF